MNSINKIIVVFLASLIIGKGQAQEPPCYPGL